MHTGRAYTSVHDVGTEWRLIAGYSEYRSFLLVSVQEGEGCYLYFGSEPASQPTLPVQGVRLNANAPYIAFTYPPVQLTYGPVWARCHGSPNEDSARVSVIEVSHPPECRGHIH
jgi:hypothetical protein